MERRVLVQVHARVCRKTVTHCSENSATSTKVPLANQEAARTSDSIFIGRYFNPSLAPAIA